MLPNGGGLMVMNPMVQSVKIDLKQIPVFEQQQMKS